MARDKNTPEMFKFPTGEAFKNELAEQKKPEFEDFNLEEEAAAPKEKKANDIKAPPDTSIAEAVAKEIERRSEVEAGDIKTDFEEDLKSLSWRKKTPPVKK